LKRVLNLSKLSKELGVESPKTARELALRNIDLYEIRSLRYELSRFYTEGAGKAANFSEKEIAERVKGTMHFLKSGRAWRSLRCMAVDCIYLNTNYSQKDIAIILNVSTRTIRRDMRIIEKLSNPFSHAQARKELGIAF